MSNQLTDIGREGGGGGRNGMGVIVNLSMCERRGTEVHCTQYILESNCMFI